MEGSRRWWVGAKGEVFLLVLLLGWLVLSRPSSANDVELVVAVDVGVKETFPCVHERDLRLLVNLSRCKTEKPCIPQYPPDSSPAHDETTPD